MPQPTQPWNLPKSGDSSFFRRVFGQNTLDPTRFMPHLWDLTESSEILAKYDGNLTRSSKISLDPARSH